MSKLKKSIVSSTSETASQITEPTKVKSKRKLKQKNAKGVLKNDVTVSDVSEKEANKEKPKLKKKFGTKNKKTKNLNEVQLPVDDVENRTHTVHTRKVRLATDEKTATIKEVQEATKASIFNEVENSVLEWDYINREEANTSGLLAEYSDEDYGEVTDKPLKLTKEIAEAFGIERSVDPTVSETEQTFFNEEAYSGENTGESIVPIEDGVSEEVLDEVLEENSESKEEPTEKVSNLTDVVARLNAVAVDYFNQQEEFNEEVCSIDYSQEDVDSVVISEESNIQLANYKVYINGELKGWDNLFEVKVSAGSLVEIETGVRLCVPNFVKVRLSAVSNLKDKYALERISEDRFLSLAELKEPIVMAFRAGEGAYLSKVGRVIECQLIV